MRVRRSNRRRPRGYTLIEVMMALGVLTAGSVGILALTQAATRGNAEARQMSTGTMLAQRWVERLRRDALHWTLRSRVADPGALARTRYLSQVQTGAAPWFVPEPDPVGQESHAADYYGQDTRDTNRMHFCSNVRLEWIYPGRAMRADVRVWWARRGAGSSGMSAGNLMVGCGGGVDPNALTGDYRVRMTYATTIIRYTQVPRI